MLAAAQGVACWYASTELDGSGKTDMPAPNAIRRAAMIPSRTTFHMAVGASTHVMQRRTIPVLATRQRRRTAGKPRIRPQRLATPCSGERPKRLVGADDPEVLADEDMVRP